LSSLGLRRDLFRRKKDNLVRYGNIRIRLLLGIILFQVMGPAFGLCAERIDEKRWSLAFEGVTVSEALEILSQKTGVRIQATKGLDSRVRKSYQGKTIDQILKDLLRNTNYSIVWSYSRQETTSVQIRVFEKSKNLTSSNRPIPSPGKTLVQETPPLRPLPGRRSLPREDPVHRAPLRPSVEENAKEPTDSVEEAARSRGEPPRTEEALGSQPEQPN
jgi:hypothetical protein